MVPQSGEMEVVACPLCESVELQRICTKGQFGLPCNVAICPDDGMVMLAPRWSRQRYQQFYRDEYDTYYRPAVLTDESDESKFKNVKLIFSRLENLSLLGNLKSALDIGAGMGWSLQWIKRNHPSIQDLAAIESSEHYIAVPDMMNPRGSLKNSWFRSVHTYYFNTTTLERIALQSNLEPLHMGTSNSELWGIFRRRQNQDSTKQTENPYESQLAVIRAHQKKNRFVDLRIALRRWLGNKTN